LFVGQISLFCPLLRPAQIIPCGIHALDEPVVDGAQRIGAQALTRLCKHPLRRHALRQGAVSQTGKSLNSCFRLLQEVRRSVWQCRQTLVESTGSAVMW
jgi:hypothetical protein